MQNLDLPIDCIVEFNVTPGQELLPGQIIGRIKRLRRGRMISPWLESGTIIDKIDAFEGDFKRH